MKYINIRKIGLYEVQGDYDGTPFSITMDNADKLKKRYEFQTEVVGFRMGIEIKKFLMNIVES